MKQAGFSKREPAYPYSGKGVDAFLADLLSLVRRVRNAFPITGIAVSLAGIVNGDTGELLLPSQFFPAFTA
ncbi:hypothetical protein M5E89_02980 [Acidaminococcus intestini]|nr:hypothetical protein M5E89_02980 [Acidaminococcus intestini]